MAFKGEYKNNVSYSVGDSVMYTDGVFYHLVYPAPSGVPPTETRYWNRVDQLLAQAMQAIVDYQVASSGLTRSDLANNLTTTATGKALDARQGKAIKEAIDALGTRVTALEEAAETSGGNSEETPEAGTGGET